MCAARPLYIFVCWAAIRIRSLPVKTPCQDTFSISKGRTQPDGTPRQPMRACVTGRFIPAST